MTSNEDQIKARISKRLQFLLHGQQSDPEEVTSQPALKRILKELENHARILESLKAHGCTEPELEQATLTITTALLFFRPLVQNEPVPALHTSP